MRCQSASGSIQGYINCDNPAPDEDTLLTLIETNDQLSVALSKYQRGILNARKTLGANAAPNNGTADATLTATAPSPSPSPPTEPVSSGAVRPVPPPPPPPRNTNTDLGSPVSPIDPTTTAFAYAPISNGTGSRYQYNSEDFQVQNPFADSNTTTATKNFNAATQGVAGSSYQQPRNNYNDYGLFHQPVPSTTHAPQVGQPLNSNPV